MAESATGIHQWGRLVYYHHSNQTEPLTLERAIELFNAGEEIEAPNAGAGSYVDVGHDMGLGGGAELVESSSSAGDWLIKVGDVTVFQRNRHPYHGFGYRKVT